LVTTGDANADAGTLNMLNSTDVDLGGSGNNCGCDEDMNSSAVTVDTNNDDGISMIINGTNAAADTGDNTARGSRGGRGGWAGDIDSDGSNNNGGATAGNGGDGGNGGLGGEVNTGDSTSNAGAINIMNTTLVRVRH
jgi:hypothetical protein